VGLFLRQDENRSELQSKVISDLQRKLHETSALEGDPSQPDPKFLENQHQTRPAGIIVGLLLFALVGLTVYVLTTIQR
jgi:hypothetical protein